MSKGKLYLIPNIIADDTQNAVISSHVCAALNETHYFLAEDIRTARRYLSSLKLYPSIETLEFHVLDKDTRWEDLRALLDPLFQGRNVGVISEAGCPGIADPGAIAARFAHEHSFKVIPLVGPSAILLALMAAGLNGQRFAFHGYLPIDAQECAKVIHDLERESKQKNQTQILIETPYRNNHIKELLLKNLKNDTLLCIAVGITGMDEAIKTLTVRKWKSLNYEMPKAPAVFLFLSF